MNLQPTDIMIRQTNGKESLWISQRYIMEALDISYKMLTVLRDRYKKTVRACDLAKSKEFLPDSGKGWRWGKTNLGFYYCYDNIPDRSPVFFRSKLGSEQELKDSLNQLSSGFKNSFKDAIKITLKQKALEYFSNDDVKYYMYDANVLFNQEKATELATAKA